MPPEKIIVEDISGDGFFIAILQKKEVTNADEIYVHLYKAKEYYHSLESALKDF